MNNAEYLKVMALLSAAYPKAEIPEQTLEVYRLVLEPYDAEVMLKAALLHITSGRWFPTIQEMIEAQRKVMDGGVTESAYEAWASVMDAIHAGYGRNADVDEIPTLSLNAKTAAKRIGWREICMSDEIGVERAHFFRAYQDLQDRTATKELIESINPIYKQVAQLLESGGKQKLTNGRQP